MSAYYHTNILPWTIIPDESRRFKLAVKVALAIYVVLAVIPSIVTVPKVERSRVQEIPPQLAKLILEREKPKPPPPPKVEEKKKEEEKPKKEEKKEEKKKEEKKKEEKKKEEKKPEPEKPVEPPEKPKIDIEAARKKAAKSGLLALSDDLADLRDTRVPDIGKNIAVTKTPTARAAPASEPQLITSTSTKGSRGVDTSSLARAGRRTTGGELQGRSVDTVESPVEAQAKAEKDLSSSRGGRKSPRTNEEVTLVFEKYKNTLTQMHQRALRTDPNAKGKVLFEITITPAGTVTACRVLHSDFDAPDFLSKVVARIKSFEFGAKDVEEVTITYPVEFIPLS